MPELSRPESLEQPSQDLRPQQEGEKSEFTLKFLPIAILGGFMGALVGVSLYAILGFYLDIFITLTFLIIGALVGLGVRIGAMGNFHLAYGLTALVLTIFAMLLANAFLLSLIFNNGDWLSALGGVFSIDWWEANSLIFFGDFDADVEFGILNIVMAVLAPFVALGIPLRRL
jgi:hypothetical protein